MPTRQDFEGVPKTENRLTVVINGEYQLFNRTANKFLLVDPSMKSAAPDSFYERIGHTNFAHSIGDLAIVNVGHDASFPLIGDRHIPNKVGTIPRSDQVDSASSKTAAHHSSAEYAFLPTSKIDHEVLLITAYLKVESQTFVGLIYQFSERIEVFVSESTYGIENALILANNVSSSFLKDLRHLRRPLR